MATTQPGIDPSAPQVQRWRSLATKYFPPEEVDNALKVIAFESGGDPGIPSTIWDERERSVGLFQINTNDNAHPQMRTAGYDPESNIAYAASLWRQSGWVNDWTAAARYYGLDGASRGGNMAEPKDEFDGNQGVPTGGAGAAPPTPSGIPSPTYGTGGEVGYTATSMDSGEVADYAVQIGRYEQDIATSQQKQTQLRERANKAWLASSEVDSLKKQLQWARVNKNQAEIDRLTPLIAEQDKIAADWQPAQDAIKAETDREKQLQKNLSDARAKYAQAVAKSGEVATQRDWEARQSTVQRDWQAEQNQMNRDLQTTLAMLNKGVSKGDITLQQAQQAFLEEMQRAQLALQQRQQAISGLTGANNLVLQGSQWALPEGSTNFPGYEPTGPLAKVAKQIGVRYTPPVPTMIRFNPRQDVLDALAGKYGGSIPAPGGAGAPGGASAGAPGSPGGAKPYTGRGREEPWDVVGTRPTGQAQTPTYGPNGEVGYAGSPGPTSPTYGPAGEVGYLPSPPMLSPADRARLNRNLPPPLTGMF